MSFAVRASCLCLLLSALLPATDWTGAGAQPIWSLSTNWSAGAPSSGGPVAFPAGPTVLVALNDILAGTSFTPSFSGNGYVLVGNRINLIAPLSATGDATTNVIGLPMQLAGERLVTVAPSGSTANYLILGGVLSGSGSIKKTGTGTLVVAGANTCTGTSKADAGVLMVTGTLPGPMALRGGTLAGNGIVGSIDSEGFSGSVLAPGTDVPGALTVNGTVVMVDTATLTMRIDGTTAGSGYSQLVVKGAVSFSSVLALDMGFTPALGDSFILIDNDGTDAIATGGSAPAQTASLATNAGTMQVSYVGGTGNDLVVTCTGPFTPTALGLTSSAPSVTVGTSVTLTATVTADPSTPTGSVEFRDGSAVLGTATVNGSGVATMTFPATGAGSLGVGTHRFIARYLGAAGTFGPSTSTVVSQVVLPASGTFATATNLESSLNPAQVGQSVTYTAQVWSAGGTPTGTVTFKDGGTTIGSAVALSTAGTASITTTFPSATTHTITAVYSGATTFAASTSVGLDQQVITPGATVTSTTLISSRNPADFHDFITFTAKVLGGSSPTGTVRFESGTTFLGVATLVGSFASITTNALPVGTSTIKAIYQGDGTSATSTSAGLAQVVRAAGSGGGGGGGSVDGGGGGCGAGGGVAVVLLLSLGLAGRRRR